MPLGVFDKLLLAPLPTKLAPSVSLCTCLQPSTKSTVCSDKCCKKWDENPHLNSSACASTGEKARCAQYKKLLASPSPGKPPLVMMKIEAWAISLRMTTWKPPSTQLL